MADINNPYMHESWSLDPGVAYERLTMELVELARIFGLNFSPKAQEALNILVIEVSDWWKDNKASRSIEDGAAFLATILKWVHPKLNLE